MDDGRLYLGIDYGGNAVKLGLVDAYGQLSGRASRPTVDLTDKVECRAFAADVAESSLISACSAASASAKFL